MADRLKVLMLMPYLPYPPESGGRTRSFHLIKYLSESDDIFLAAFIRNHEEAGYVEGLRPYCRGVRVFPRNNPFSLRTVLRYLCSSRPYYETINWSEDVRDFLKESTRRRYFDVVHLECSYLGQYLGFLPQGRRFLQTQNVEYWVLDRYRAVSRNPLLRLALRFDSRRLRRSEQTAWRAADAVGTVSEADQGEVRRFTGATPLWVVPNGVEIRPGNCTQPRADSQQIIFTGNFRYFANVDGARYLCREILPLVRSRCPEAELLIVGAEADRKLERLADCPGVTIKGRVPDLAPYVDSAAVYVCPLRTGSGTKLKVLEAMAAQKAIVSTSVGAEGLSVRDGEHLLVADDPSSFANAVCRLLADAELRTRLGGNACNLARERYSWKQIAGKLREAYVSMVETCDSIKVETSALKV